MVGIMNKKIWILDLDGTAADTVGSIAHTANTVLEELGLPTHPVKNYNYYAGDGQFEIVKRALRAAGDEELRNYDVAMARYIELFKTGCTYGVKPVDGLKEALLSAKEAGIKLAILTNKRHVNAIEVVEYAYGKGFFDYILGNMDEFPKKPAPDGVYRILEHFAMNKEDCLYVGDTDVDMQTGNNAGVYTVGVTWGFRDRKELEDNNADIIIDRPEQLLEI